MSEERYQSSSAKMRERERESLILRHIYHTSNISEVQRQTEKHKSFGKKKTEIYRNKK